MSVPAVFTGLENQRHCWVMRSQKQKCGAACGLSTSLKKHESGHADVSSLLLAARTLIYVIFSKPHFSSLLLSQVCWASPPLYSILSFSTSGHMIFHQIPDLSITMVTDETLLMLPSTFYSLLRCYLPSQWPTCNLQVLCPSCLHFEIFPTEIDIWMTSLTKFALFVLMLPSQVRNLTTPIYLHFQ